MIYETAYVLKSDASEEQIKKSKEIILESLESVGGEVVIEEDWGVKTFAQPTEDGVTRGNYIYYMYKAPTTVNEEIERRFRISEDVIKFLIVKLGEDAHVADYIKNYKELNKNSTDGRSDIDKDRRAFSKRKSCWFSAKKTQPDWKDPSSYAWLVNEFGKISPARVTGLRPKYQRMANAAIKRGRIMGIISYMSNHTFR